MTTADVRVTFRALWSDGSVSPASGSEATARARQIARAIARQLGGGGTLEAMVEARHFTVSCPGFSALPFGALQFRFSGNRRVNGVRISLNERDLDDVRYLKLPGPKALERGNEPKLVAEEFNLLAAAETESFLPYRDLALAPFHSRLDLGGSCDQGCVLDAAR